MEYAGVNRNIISPILAHKVKGVDRYNSDHEIKDFLEKFKKALPYLLPQTVEKVKAEQQKEVQKLQNKIDDLELKLATNTANLLRTLHSYLDKAGIEHEFEDEAIVDE